MSLKRRTASALAAVALAGGIAAVFPAVAAASPNSYVNTYDTTSACGAKARALANSDSITEWECRPNGGRWDLYVTWA
ncbi:hypothetical protein HPO96_02650 [Kribbella sandramycini]|uniref:Uncharacterized protein n=1 Tax=Kribbella sandramycini TaxID=60450 RepID=A0A7Y4NWT2_9ACTN|nr:hypothetical protein [Kribbella sandramycini]MBB6568270.1 hypothetical protein [Kribbella sandramycini]NOL39137.1 hypothetical protein [Kribbella sandramycini]